jgi:hypothetical protein
MNRETANVKREKARLFAFLPFCLVALLPRCLFALLPFCLFAFCLTTNQS